MLGLGGCKLTSHQGLFPISTSDREREPTLRYYNSSPEMKSSWAQLFRILKVGFLCLILFIYSMSMDSEKTLHIVCTCSF